MMRVFAFIGVLAIALIVAAGGFFGFAVYKGVNDINEGTEYAKTVFETWGKDWNADYLRGEASDVMLAAGPDFEGIAIAFTQTFGTVEQVDQIECPEWQSSVDQEGPITVLGCLLSARSTKGQLDVVMEVQRRGEWKTNLVFVRDMIPRDDRPSARSVSTGIDATSIGASHEAPCVDGFAMDGQRLTIGNGCATQRASHVRAD